MKKITVSGNAGKDATVVKAGEQNLLKFSVGSTHGWGDKKTTDWFDVNVWIYGDKMMERAKKLAELIKKGTKVLVTGNFKDGGEFNNKIEPRDFDDIELIGGKPVKAESDSSAVDDEIPF